MKTKTKTKKNFIELRIPKPSEEVKQILKIGMLTFAPVLVTWFLISGAIMIITDWAKIKTPLFGEIFWGIMALLTSIKWNLSNKLNKEIED